VELMTGPTVVARSRNVTQLPKYLAYDLRRGSRMRCSIDRASGMSARRNQPSPSFIVRRQLS
jgi:hypothetical protein